MLAALAIGAGLGACTGSTESVPPEPVAWQFTSSFDDAPSFEALFPANGTGWTNVQLVQPDGSHAIVRSTRAFESGLNRVVLDSDRVASRRNSVRFEALSTGSDVSKAALVKEGTDFRPGDWIEFRCKLFLDSTANAENTFFVDFESTQFPGYPGRRIALTSNQSLILESKGTGGTYGSGPNVSAAPQLRIPLPTGRWVDLRLELRLDAGENGQIDLWQDGILRLHSVCQTFPNHPEITKFDWFELGLTANSSGSFQRLWIDDVFLTKL